MISRTRPASPLLAIAVCSALAASMTTRARAEGPTLEECVAANEQSGPLLTAGHFHEAHVKLRLCAVPACPAIVREDCLAGAAKIDAMIPTVVFTARDAAGNDVAAVRVLIDGQPFASRLDGAAIEVDPGEHTFTFLVTGQPPLEKHFVIAQGEKNQRERIVIEAPPPSPPAKAESPPQPAQPDATDTGSGRRTLGLAIGVVGVVGLATGAVTGLIATNAWNNAKKDCGAPFPGACLNPTAANSDRNTTETTGTISTIAFIAGSALAVGGAVLYFLAPARDKSQRGFVRVAPAIGLSSRGVLLEGAF